MTIDAELRVLFPLHADCVVESFAVNALERVFVLVDNDSLIGTETLRLGKEIL